MKKLVPFFLIISMPIIIGAMEAPEIEEREVEAPSLGTMPPEIKLNIIKRAFWGIVDVNKSVEDNIKNLFLQRRKLMADTEFRNIVSDEKVLKEIGEELSQLLEYGINPYAPFLKVVSDFSNNPDIIKALIYVADDKGHTLLHKAARTNDLNAINILLEAGANVNVQDDDGNTPLHMAILGKSPESIKKLFSAGADVNLKNNANAAPINWARVVLTPELQQLLAQPKNPSIQ